MSNDCNNFNYNSYELLITRLQICFYYYYYLYSNILFIIIYIQIYFIYYYYMGVEKVEFLKVTSF